MFYGFRRLNTKLSPIRSLGLENHRRPSRLNPILAPVEFRARIFAKGTP
jgi:hypothetical protein